MDKYSLVYIDDNPETSLTRYLDEEFQGENYEIVSVSYTHLTLPTKA